MVFEPWAFSAAYWFSFATVTQLGFGDYFPAYSGWGFIWEYLSAAFGLGLNALMFHAFVEDGLAALFHSGHLDDAPDAQAEEEPGGGDKGCSGGGGGVVEPEGIDVLSDRSAAMPRTVV
jgi:hypothetical protein